MTVSQYDDLDDEAVDRLARAALEHYPRELHGDLALICRSENATFRLIADGRRYALRLHRDNYHSRAEIEGELAWLDALREDTGIVVPQALSDRDGARVVTVAAPDGGVRHVDLFHWIEGEQPTSGVDPAAFRRLGEITARLHAHSRTWKRPEAFRRIVWDHASMVGPQGHWGDWNDFPGLSDDDRAIIGAAVAAADAALAAYGDGPDRFGLIHADLRLTNLLLHDGDTRVIDFDDCGFGWYLHDLAAAVSFEEHHPSAPAWVENWLAGYERHAHLDDADLAVLPAMLIQRRVQLTAWMASHSQTHTARALAHRWGADTTRFARRYIENDPMPLGGDSNHKTFEVK